MSGFDGDSLFSAFAGLLAWTGCIAPRSAESFLEPGVPAHFVDDTLLGSDDSLDVPLVSESFLDNPSPHRAARHRYLTRSLADADEVQELCSTGEECWDEVTDRTLYEHTFADNCSPSSNVLDDEALVVEILPRHVEDTLVVENLPSHVEDALVENLPSQAVDTLVVDMPSLLAAGEWDSSKVRGTFQDIDSDACSTQAESDADLAFDGELESRGLRWWDTMWQTVYLSLRGHTLHVYHDDLEGGRVLYAAASLRRGYALIPSLTSERHFQLRPTHGSVARDVFRFELRAPDRDTSEVWMTRLRVACEECSRTQSDFGHSVFSLMPMTAIDEVQTTHSGTDVVGDGLHGLLAAFPPPVVGS
jgi:hypothetical protein